MGRGCASRPLKQTRSEQEQADQTAALGEEVGAKTWCWASQGSIAGVNDSQLHDQNRQIAAVTPPPEHLVIIGTLGLHPSTSEQVASGPVTKCDDLAPLLCPMQLVQNKGTTALPPPRRGKVGGVGLLLKADWCYNRRSPGAQERPLLPPSGLLRDRPIRQRALSFHPAPSGPGSDLGIARSAPAAPEAEAPQGRSPRAFTTLLLELLCLPLLCTEAHAQTTTLVSNTGETRSLDLFSPYQKAPP